MRGNCLVVLEQEADVEEGKLLLRAIRSIPAFAFGGLGFRVEDVGFRVWGSGFRVQGSGFRVQG